MKKIVLVFGTRPEAIKMCPLIKAMRQDEDDFQVIVCVTGQHKEMLQQVLDCFDIEPDYNLSIMKKGQNLFDITTLVLEGIRKVLEKEKPDWVFVHGDTTTSFAAALAAFYMHIPVGHVEAGLRTYDLEAPYPEEFNRQCVGVMASLHFAPTKLAKENLLKEGKKESTIYVTGNTAIDAMKQTVKEEYESPLTKWIAGRRLLVLTAHRRENQGEALTHIFQSIKQIIEEFPDVCVVYPVHMNPLIQEKAREMLGDIEAVRLVEPLDVIAFHNLLNQAYIILTDSGGIQEEAPSLGKPVLVLRDTTERPEGITSGTLKLIGTKKEAIYSATKELLTKKESYDAMSKASNPYGDGMASQRIIKALKKELDTSLKLYMDK